MMYFMLNRLLTTLPKYVTIKDNKEIVWHT